MVINSGIRLKLACHSKGVLIKDITVRHLLMVPHEAPHEGSLHHHTETTITGLRAVMVALIWLSNLLPEAMIDTDQHEAGQVDPNLVQWDFTTAVISEARAWQIHQDSTLEMADQFCTWVSSYSTYSLFT